MKPDTLPQYRALRCSEFNDIAASIRDSLAQLGITIPPDCELERILRDFEWIGQYDGMVLDPTGGSGVDDPTRAIASVWRAHRMTRIANALERTICAKGAAERARCLRKRIDRLVSHHPQSLDTLWELEVAGALWRTGMEVELGDTDVVLHYQGERAFGVECKHPRSLRGVGSALQSGFGQLRDRGIPGMVAVNLDAVIHQSGGMPKPFIIDADSPEEFTSGLDAVIENALRGVEPIAYRHFNAFAYGAVFACTSVGLCTSPLMIMHATRGCYLVNPDIERSEVGAKLLLSLLCKAPE